MALQNRVWPNGDIVSDPARGTFMGNRGGRVHDSATRQLHPSKRWTSRQWICCLLSFKNRHRTVMGQGYTELFFMDEITALAAGHRPCFECRRADANAFAQAWCLSADRSTPPRAAEIDRQLHAERLDRKSKRLHEMQWGNVATGSVVLLDNGRFVAKGPDAPLEWSSLGYRKISGIKPATQVACLTPPSIQHCLHHGYAPQWHETAGSA